MCCRLGKWVGVLVPVLLASVFTPIPTGGKDKKIDPRIRDLKSIFITGSGTAAIKARGRLEEKTCYKLAQNKDKADAVLTFQQDVYQQRGRATVTAELADTKSGDLLWASSQKAETMFNDVGDPADKAMKRVLDELNKVGCK